MLVEDTSWNNFFFFPGSNITCFTFYIHLSPIYWLSLVKRTHPQYADVAAIPIIVWKQICAPRVAAWIKLIVIKYFDRPRLGQFQFWCVSFSAALVSQLQQHFFFYKYLHYGVLESEFHFTLYIIHRKACTTRKAIESNNKMDFHATS
jgi:hypothetical protein